MAKINNYILVCGGTGCRASRSEEIIAALRRALDRTGESERTRVIRTGCFGFCEAGPIVKMIPTTPSTSSGQTRKTPKRSSGACRQRPQGRAAALHGPRHGAARTRQQAHEVLQAAAAHRPAELRVHRPREHRRIHRPRRLRSPGQKCSALQPDHVLQEIIDSGLRGRGGGGFPTGLKWKITRDAKADRKYVSATPTKGIRAHSWTVRSSKAIPTRSSKRWPSTATARAPRTD